MVDLRERSKKLYQSLAGHMVTECLEKADCDLIESFAREIRNDAFEEAAVRIEVLADMDKDYGGDPSGRRDLRLLCAGMIRALKDDTTALAAKESEK